MLIEGVIALLIPIFALSIPIVAILTKHQKEMAQTFAQQHLLQSHTGPELMQMREEMRLLREQINQQSILLDDIRSQGKNLKERVNENA
jgi:hypothetical protein